MHASVSPANTLLISPSSNQKASVLVFWAWSHHDSQQSQHRTTKCRKHPRRQIFMKISSHEREGSHEWDTPVPSSSVDHEGLLHIVLSRNSQILRYFCLASAACSRQICCARLSDGHGLCHHSYRTSWSWQLRKSEIVILWLLTLITRVHLCSLSRSFSPSLAIALLSKGMPTPLGHDSCVEPVCSCLIAHYGLFCMWARVYTPVLPLRLLLIL